MPGTATKRKGRPPGSAVDRELARFVVELDALAGWLRREPEGGTAHAFGTAVRAVLAAHAKGPAALYDLARR